MKNIKIIFVPILLFLVAFGCSTDHDAPTFATYDSIEKPSNVLATYDKDTDSVIISWDMADTQDVIHYYITISDSSLFDFGNKITKTTVGDETEASIKAAFVFADVDSAIRYFDVSAIYDNETTFNSLIGPRSDEPDSALIYRK